MAPSEYDLLVSERCIDVAAEISARILNRPLNEKETEIIWELVGDTYDAAYHKGKKEYEQPTSHNKLERPGRHRDDTQNDMPS